MKTTKTNTIHRKESDKILSGNFTYVVSFFLPLVMMISIYFIRKMYPFGDNCYLRSDMYHQYAPFFSELWHKLRTGGSLTYSWDIGMGTNFTALYAYYLASPTNWLIALFPQKSMIEIMNALILLKIAGSSLSFVYYLTKHFNNKSILTVLCGIFYAMSGYLAAYSWNIMWLDCIILVPLIMLGLERLVKENKCILYSISLGLCIFTNYYIAIMVCMSVVLYFIVLIISYDGPRSFVSYFKKIVNFGFFSLMAGGIGACLLLPELYAFSLSASSDMTFPQTLTSYFSILEVLTRHLIDVPVHLGLEHFPNIYCSVAVFLLIPLYIMDKHVNVREKAGKFIILLIFITSFNLNIPNFIWHGLHYPNSLPARPAFIYIFFMLSMCYEVLSHIDKITNKMLTASLWISIGFLFIVEQIFTRDFTYDFKIVYISGAFIIIYAFLMYFANNIKLKIPVVLFLVFSVSIIECTLNMDATGLATTSRGPYLLDYNAVETVTKTVADNDKSFYRMDKEYGARSKNDGAWHNYRSISTFSSTSSEGMTNLFDYLGLENSANAYGYNGSTLVTNMLFAEKYTISNKILVEDSLRYFYTGSDGEFIYHNNYSLPIGFTISDIASKNLYLSNSYNGIENQNLIIEAMTGISSVFTLSYSYPTETDCYFKPIKNGHIYLNVGNPNCSSITVYINEKSYTFNDLTNNRHIVDIGYVTTTDQIVIEADSNMNLSVYNLEEDKFISAYNELSSGAYNVTKFSDTHFEGTVYADKDKSMLFSIPYDKGWTVYVDGKKVDTYAWQKALLCLDISAGSHTLELKYTPVNLYKGILITLISIIILAGIYFFGRLLNNGRINKEKLPGILKWYLEIKPAVEIDDNTDSLLEEMDDFENLEISNDDASDYDEDSDYSEDEDFYEASDYSELIDNNED